jgi:GT2 family glycosyltransferase
MSAVDTADGAVSVEHRLRLSIVICTRNRLEPLRRYSLAALMKEESAHHEVVVVDHGSTDGTGEFMFSQRQTWPQLKYVHVAPDVSFGGARNAGVAGASGDIVIFLDDDAVPLASWAEEALHQFSSRDDLFVLGGPVFSGDSSDIENPGWVKGCNMAFRAELFARFCFDTNLKFLGSIYFDEHDLIDRIRAHGHPVFYSEKFAVRHYSQSGGSRKRALGHSLNRAYSHCKQQNAMLYYKYLLRGLLKMALSPSRRTFSRMKARDNFDISAVEWMGVLWLLWFYQERGVGGVFRWFWTAFFVIPVTAASRRNVEGRMLVSGSSLSTAMAAARID